MKIIKTKRLAGILGCLLALILTLSLVTPALAVSPPSHRFWGTVTIGTESAPAGTVVSARIGGEEYGTATVGSDGDYDLYVNADDPDIPGKDGGEDGDTIEFYVDEALATPTYTFKWGDGSLLNLIVTVPAIDSVVPDPTTHVAGAEQVIAVTVTTSNVADGAMVTVSFVDELGDPLDPAITNTGAIAANSTVVNITVTDVVVAGAYQVKVVVDAVTDPSLTAYVITSALSSDAEITAYSFPEETGAATIGDGTIDIEVANGTDVTGLVATFTTSDAIASIQIGGVDQVSGTTANDFTNPVVYVVTAEDGTTTRDWTVTVTVALPSSEAEILTYSFPEETGAATIGDGTIDIEVANGTDVTGLVATFTTSDNITSIQVGGVDQVSGTTANDFTNPVVYVVTAEDGTTTKDWAVTVTVAALSTEAEILTYSFPEQTGAATIGDGTIDIEVANGTDVTALVATFTTSDAIASIQIGGVDQVSGTTANDFTAPVVYVVTAEDGTTTRDWTVTVTVAAAPSYDVLIDLNDNGWTLVSADKYILSSGDNTSAFLGSVSLKYKYTDSGYLSATVADLKPVEAIYVKTTGTDGQLGLNYSGVVPVPSSKDLDAGWNLISSATADNVNDILSSLRYVQVNEQQGVGLATLVSQGSYNLNTGSWYIDATTWANLSDIFMNPFDGYWVYMNAAKSFGVIPD